MAATVSVNRTIAWGTPTGIGVGDWMLLIDRRIPEVHDVVTHMLDDVTHICDNVMQMGDTITCRSLQDAASERVFRRDSGREPGVSGCTCGGGGGVFAAQVLADLVADEEAACCGDPDMDNQDAGGRKC